MMQLLPVEKFSYTLRRSEVPKLKKFLFVLALAIFAVPAFGQANGKLQIHYGDVGQADSAVLISPLGEVVLFDNGDYRACDRTMAYLAAAQITKIDYMIISHYHADHFGCTQQVLARYPIRKTAYDRGEPFPPLTKNNKPTPFGRYFTAVGNKRQAVTDATTIVLDANSANPVRINIAAFNAAGIETDDENDRSVAAVIHFGEFDVMMAGDLSGYNTARYKDIETTVSERVGQIEVYKVNHHGSDHSSNEVWLAKLRPRIAIISPGDGNSYGHPRAETLKRLHDAGIDKTYWTETGTGAIPQEGKDVVANGTIRVQIAPGANKFTVSYGNKTHTYSVWPTHYNGAR